MPNYIAVDRVITQSWQKPLMHLAEPGAVLTICGKLERDRTREKPHVKVELCATDESGFWCHYCQSEYRRRVGVCG